MLSRLRIIARHLQRAEMSTTHNTNVAVSVFEHTSPQTNTSIAQCCTVPAVHSDYTPKGSYKSLGTRSIASLAAHIA